jgi:tetraacyldisaccharide 4'-kinase
VSDFETNWRHLVSGEERAWWASSARTGLWALSGIYAGIVSGYRAGFDLGLLKTTRLPCPVLGIGNITVGGTGKTTTVRWLVRRLQEWGVHPAVLSYGYRAGAGKKERNAVTVVAGPEGIRTPVSLSGDEPQMLARSLPGVPVLIGRKRIYSGQQAWDEFRADACVLDDSFQYWRLEKDLELLLVNAANPFGYGHLLPRGMLREPLRGLRRAGGVILTHAAAVSTDERQRLRARIEKLKPGIAVAEAVHEPVRLRDHQSGALLGTETLREGRWLALSGLGQPESFENSLVQLGAREAAPARFRDHHAYTVEELEEARARVRSEGLAGIVTTEKDAVKIPAEWLEGCNCAVLEVDLRFLSGQEQIERLLRERIVNCAPSKDVLRSETG